MMHVDSKMTPILTHGSPFEVTMATAISRYKLEKLIDSGLIKAKRVDRNTVLIEWESVQKYIDGLPDAAPLSEEAQPQDPMDSGKMKRGARPWIYGFVL